MSTPRDADGGRELGSEMSAHRGGPHDAGDVRDTLWRAGYAYVNARFAVPRIALTPPIPCCDSRGSMVSLVSWHMPCRILGGLLSEQLLVHFLIELLLALLHP